MALRGFDDYELTLGDEMRGERACLGKTLEDAERDLCIKAELLAAIENADIEAFPNRSVVPGYVRAYARYLGMNPDRCYERFCEQSGFRSPLATFGMVPDPAKKGARGGEAGAILGAIGGGLTQSRFAYAPRTRRIGAPVSLGGLFSAVALVGLVGGLTYGGYALLQDIQRVGFAPLPEAPAVVADAPVITAPDIEGEVLARSPRPDVSAYDGGGALALNLPSELPIPVAGRRDGPISAIDPATSGVFAARMDHRAALARDAAGDRPVAVFATVTPVDPFTPALAAGEPRPDAAVVATEAADPAVDPDRVDLIAAEEAWVRIRDAAGAVIFERLMQAGETFALPERLEGPVLRAGNAGGVYLRVGGVLRGPIGARGRVVKNLSLAPDDLRTGVPVASALPNGLGESSSEVVSASANVER